MQRLNTQRRHFFRTIIGVLFIVSLLAPWGALFIPQKAEAVVPVAETPNFFSQLFTMVESTLTTIEETLDTLKEWGVDGVAWYLANQILHKMATDTVKWIQSGFEGNPAFVTNPDEFFMDVADKEIGNFLKSTQLSFLCSPFSLRIKLALAVRAGKEDEKTACSLTGAMANVQNFLDGNFLDGGWDRWFEVTNNPRNNVYGAFLLTEGDLARRILNAKDREKTLLGQGQGFLSFKQCSVPKACPSPAAVLRDGKCFEVDEDGEEIDTGAAVCPAGKDKITTPGKVINDQLNGVLKSGKNKLEIADEIDEVASALVQQLFVWVFSSDGLLGSSADFEEPSRDFAYTLSGSDLRIPQGGSGTFEITIKTTRGTPKPVTLEVQAPTNTSVVQMTNSPCTPSPSCTVSVTIAATDQIQTGTYTVFVYGTPGSNGETATIGNFKLTVTDEFRYTIAVDPTTVTVSPSLSAVLRVDVRLVSGGTKQILLSVAGLPQGVLANIPTSLCTPDCTVNITLTADSSAIPGTYPGVTVVGSPGSAGEPTQSTVFTVYIPPPGAPVVTLTATPGSLPFNGGRTTLDWISTNDPTSCVASSSPVGVWSRTLRADELREGIERDIPITQGTTFILSCENDAGRGEGRTTVSTAPPDLAVSCLPMPSSIAPGRSTSWIALPSGGDGSYTYLWSGHSQIDTLTSNPITASYPGNGTFSGAISVRSGDGQSIGPQACALPLTVGPVGGPLTVSCFVAPNPADGGETVTFAASASGGDGIYTYTWHGSNIEGKTGSVVQASYPAASTVGTSVEVTSGDSQNINKGCPTLRTNP